MITLVQVQAFMFPEAEEAIISFNRTGLMGICKTLQMFLRDTQARLAKLYAKTLLVVLLETAVVEILLGMEMLWAFGGVN